jgi:hypothetical protein
LMASSKLRLTLQQSPRCEYAAVKLDGFGVVLNRLVELVLC